MLIQQVRTETQHKEHALKVPLGEMQLIQQGQKGIVRAVKVVYTHLPQITDRLTS